MKRLRADAVDQFFSLAERGLATVHNDTETIDSDPQIGHYEYVFEIIRSHLQRPEGHLPNAFFWSLGRPLEMAVNLGRGPPDVWWLFNVFAMPSIKLPLLPHLTKKRPGCTPSPSPSDFGATIK